MFGKSEIPILSSCARSCELRRPAPTVVVGAWKFVLSIVAGFLIERGVRMLLARPRRVLETKEIDSLWVQVSALLARTTLDILPIIGFVAGSYATLLMVNPGAVSQEVIVALIVANVIVRLAMALARMILAPVAGSLRLLPIKDVDANYIFIWTRRLTEVTVYGYALVQISQFLGLPNEGAETFLKIIGLFVTLLLVVFILQNRNLVASWLRGTDLNAGAMQPLRKKLADIWHVPALIYVLALYVVLALALEDGFSKLLQATVLTAFIVVVSQLVRTLINRTSRRIFSLRPEVKQRYPTLEARANRYQPILEKLTSIVVNIFAGITILEAWGFDAFDWLRTPFGQRVTGSLITIALLLVIAIIIWEITSAVVERYLSRGEGDVSARSLTILPLLRTAMLVLLVTLVVMVSTLAYYRSNRCSLPDKPGDKVINPSKKDWGIGQIQSIINNKVTVNFENVGKKVINCKEIILERISKIE